MILNVFDDAFNRIDIIDVFVETEIVSRYFGHSTLIATIQADEDNIKNFIKNEQSFRIITKSTDPTRGYIVDYIDFKDDDNSEIIIVAESLSIMLGQRVVEAQQVSTGTVEDVLRDLVTMNAITPKLSHRKIPKLVLGPLSGITIPGNESYANKQLDVALFDICRKYEISYEILMDHENKNYVFAVYNGKDRSTLQQENSHIIFSKTFENVSAQSYLDDKTNFKTTAYVAGEGEGINRTVLRLNDAFSGFARREVFFDARDLQRTYLNSNDVEVTLTESQYLALLEKRGMNRLSEYERIQTFTNATDLTSQYLYGKDYFLGDKTTSRNDQLGLVMHSRIVVVREVYNENGYKMSTEFGTAIPTLIEKLKREANSGSSAGSGSGSDGVGLEYTLTGDSIGLKREDEVDFTYINLSGAIGPQGIQGPQGIKGETGLKGVTGLTGPKGDKGNPFTYADFTTPQLAGLKGEKGDKGLTGNQGSIGPQGEKGLTGDTGLIGPQGIQGETGLVGPVGAKGNPFIYTDFLPAQLEGLRGPQGLKGNTGASGTTGATGEKGATGDKGLKGDQGIQGIIGLTGPKGDTGNTGAVGAKGNPFIYTDFTVPQLAGLKGEQGIQGIQGLIGPKGETGSTGLTGAKGSPFIYTDFTQLQLAGLKGAKGDQGIQGIQGEKGPVGNTGQTGAKGETGSIGLTGEIGLKGDKGDKGDIGLAGLKGDTGLRGIQGLHGDNGISVTHTWAGTSLSVTSASGTTTSNLKGDAGAKGDTGNTGAKGDTGAKGELGIQGIQGIQGVKGNPFIYSDFTAPQLAGLKGAKGDTGSTGSKGDTGETGLRGIQGLQGIQGTIGLTGPKGDKGDQGIQGVPGAAIADSVEWANVLSKPTTFPPATHTHTIANVTSLQATLDAKELKQYLGSYVKLASDLPLSYPKQRITHMFGRNTDGWPFPYCGIITYSMHSNEAMIQYAIDYQNGKSPTGKIKFRMSTYNDNSWGDWFEPETTTGSQDKVDAHNALKTNPHGVTKIQVGLSNVENTSDVAKPISTATQTALNTKANIATPTFTGSPKAPTASSGTNTTQIATTAFVASAMASAGDNKFTHEGIEYNYSFGINSTHGGLVFSYEPV